MRSKPRSGTRAFGRGLHHLAHAGRTGRRRALPGGAGARRVRGGARPGGGVPRRPGEISDPDTRLRFMAPSAERFADAMGRLGIGNDSRVVLYSNGSIMWATRVWWMLRGFGFDGAAVLDGGFAKCRRKEDPSPPSRAATPPARFDARPRPGFFVGRGHVLARLDDDDAAMVNALAPEFFLGAGPSRYGRPGAHPGKRQRARREPSRSRRRDLRAARRGPAGARSGRRHPGQARRRLLRGRDLRDGRSSSCCTSSAIPTSPSTTARWGNGPETPPPDRDRTARQRRLNPGRRPGRPRAPAPGRRPATVPPESHRSPPESRGLAARGRARYLALSAPALPDRDMSLEFRKLHPSFGAKPAPSTSGRCATRTPSSRFARRWTATRWSSSESSGFRTTSRSPSPPGSTESFTARPASACSRRAASATRRSPTSRTSAPDGELLESDARRRLYGLANRLWHTDASFQDPRGRYSMLAALVVPEVAADTEFADMRAAYDTLPAGTKASLEGLRVHHSIAYSRQTLGFEFSEEESGRLRGAVHPLVLANPRNGRRSLYLAPTPRGSSTGRSGREAAAPRPHGARHPAGAGVPALLADGRLRDLGQPRHHAPRASVRRHRPSPGNAPRDDPRRRRPGPGRPARVAKAAAAREAAPKKVGRGRGARPARHKGGGTHRCSHCAGVGW